MSKFDYFVVFAEMRTGSNLLEANINLFDGLTCHGEAFNPSFIGFPQIDNILGITLEQREKNPGHLINAIKNDAGLAGFRYFHNHDPRVLDDCISDPRCGKIVLTRNPVDSFISWKIAKATGQWKLTNATHAKTEQVSFDEVEFEEHLQQLQDFQITLLNGLQKSGQTAFYVGYDDLSDVAVMNGLAAYLGVDARLEQLDRKLKKQNPAPALEKVVNPDAMEAALSRLDRFNLNRTPNFEPRRGPMIPAYVAAPDSGLLHLPLQGGLDDRINAWMAALDGKTPKDLRSKFSQKSLRGWKNATRPHRSFAVLRHPVVRAHHAFCTRILFDGPKVLGNIRQTLRRVHNLPVPEEPLSETDLQDYDLQAHRTAYLSFLQFLNHNLSGQTAVRTDVSWASQSAVLQGIAQFALPDIILREDRITDDLRNLCAQIGRDDMPDFPQAEDTETALLHEIYDAEVEEAAALACQRDYFTFGFDAWQAG